MNTILDFLTFLYFLSSFVVLILCMKAYYTFLYKVEETEKVIKAFLAFAMTQIQNDNLKTDIKMEE